MRTATAGYQNTVDTIRPVPDRDSRSARLDCGVIYMWAMARFLRSVVTSLWRRGAAWLASAGFVLGATLLGFVMNILGFGEMACKLPGVRSACAMVGFVKEPSHEERTLWAEAKDCSGLRVYLFRYPTGAFSEEAEKRLNAAQTVPGEIWSPDLKSLPLVVRMGVQPFPTEEDAKEDALNRAVKDAWQVCQGHDHSESRLLGAKADVEDWMCREVSGGTVCGFDGEAICRVEVRTPADIRICPE